jgi:hypothetical protein
MIMKRHNESDLDTDTGLPRKAILKVGYKVFFVLLMLLQILVTSLVSSGQNRLRRIEEAQAKSDINIARIMERLNMNPVASLDDGINSTASVQ